MDWKNIKLHGAGGISRLCGVYEIHDIMRVPEGKYKIKVLQQAAEDFIALPNICVKSVDGTPEWPSGSGRTEMEALEKALEALSSDLATLNGNLERDRFEWSDPTEF